MGEKALSRIRVTQKVAGIKAMLTNQGSCHPKEGMGKSIACTILRRDSCFLIS